MLVPVLISGVRFKFILACLALIFISFISSFDPIQDLLAKQDEFRKSHPQEKVHLHTDRVYYAVGDTIYFKAYLVNAEKNLPSIISAVLHVDLIDTKKNIIRSAIFPVEDGVARGSEILADTLAEGAYTLRAYTNWMRNSGENYFFEKTLMIAAFPGTIDTKLKFGSKGAVTKIVAPQREATGTDIRFFPESGQLVNGLNSRVGFKATGADGLGIDVSGEVVDQNGSGITKFSSGFAGIGSFEISPVAGKTYFANIRFADGKETRLPLPQVQPQGFILTTDNSQKDNLSVTMSANKGAAATEVLLVALSNNTVQYVAKSRVNSTTPATTILSKKRFPSGILQLTLFDADYKPVAERLVFIRQDDQLSVKLSIDGRSPGTRQKVRLAVESTDEEGNGIQGSFSIAVTDETKTPFTDDDEQTILSNLLLSSDLRGYIQRPNYYFKDVNAQKGKELDDLLLTQGWRRFLWTDILEGKSAAPVFQVEKGLAVSGRIINAKREPVPGAKITFLSKSGQGFIIDTIAGIDGRFRLDDILHGDSLNFSIQALSSTGMPNVTIELDHIPAQKVTILRNQSEVNLLTGATFNTFLQNSHERFDELNKNGNPRKATTLQTVTVKGKKLTRVQEAVKDSWNLNGPGNADQVITYLDLANCNNIGMCLQGRLTGVTVRLVIDPVTRAQKMLAFSTRGDGLPMMIIVDGMVTSSQSLDDIPAQDIQSIEVLRSGSYLNVYGTKGVQGVIVITTKRGDIDYNAALGIGTQARVAGNMLFGSVRGFSDAREFYSPDYSITKNAAPVSDLRSTIFWKPDVITDSEGKAFVEFFNADTPGSYRVIVEGISADGKLGRQQFHYMVK